MGAAHRLMCKSWLSPERAKGKQEPIHPKTFTAKVAEVSQGSQRILNFTIFGGSHYLSFL
jgi:hypothetical protein